MICAGRFAGFWRDEDEMAEFDGVTCSRQDAARDRRRGGTMAFPPGRVRKAEKRDPGDHEVVVETCGDAASSFITARKSVHRRAKLSMRPR